MLFSVASVISMLNLVSSLYINSNDLSIQSYFDGTNMLENNATDMEEDSEHIHKREAFDDSFNGNTDNKEAFQTSESNNLVYRPLFVYRRIQHSKRRITMYNSFAG